MPVFNMQTLFSLFSVVSLVSAYRVPPPTIAASDAHQDCGAWHIAKLGESFLSIAQFHRLDMAQFKSYNPAICVDTDVLVVGASYCIKYTPASSTAQTTTTTTTTTARLSIDPQMTQDCDGLHFVEADDTCFSISTMHGLTLGQLYAMNPVLGTRCKNLLSSQYVCVSTLVTTPERTEVVVPAPPVETPETPEMLLPSPRCFFNVKQAGRAHYICIEN